MKPRKTSAAVSRHDPEPLYRQIAQRLQQGIEAGEWAAGQALPSEAGLMQRFGVSRVTVRQAIAVLKDQGRLTARRGKGTFVAGRVVQHDLGALKGFYDALRDKGVEPDTRLLEFAMVDPAEAAAAGAGADLPLRLTRLYSLEGRPFALVTAYLPAAAFTLGEQRAERLMVYQVLEHYLGLRIGRAEVTIRCQKAVPEVARLLGLSARQQALVMERQSFSTAGQACEFMRIHIVPERFEFRLRVTGALEIVRSVHPVGGRRADADAPTAQPVSERRAR